jgi:hypothetical protein
LNLKIRKEYDVELRAVVSELAEKDEQIKRLR